MRVCHVINSLALGGAQQMLVKLAETHAACGVESHVVALRGGPLKERLDAAGVPCTSLGIGSNANLPLIRSRLRAQLDCIAPDVVQGWMYVGNLAATMARRPRHGALAWNIRHSLHGYAREKPLTGLTIRLNGMLSRRPVAIVYNAQVSREQHAAHGFFDDRALVIDNGFDLDRFRPDPAARQVWRDRLDLPGDDSLLVGHVGRFHPQKDHETMIRAFAGAAAKDPRLVLVLAGEGLDHENTLLTGLVSSLGLGSRVRLLGPVMAVHELYPAFDFFVLSSSYGEAFPNVLGEAMACGVPCITTRIGDSARIVGDLGHVVEPGDVQALSSAMITFAGKTGKPDSDLARACREHVGDHYSLSVIAERYARLYDSLSGNSLTRDCAAPRQGEL